MNGKRPGARRHSLAMSTVSPQPRRPLGAFYPILALAIALVAVLGDPVFGAPPRAGCRELARLVRVDSEAGRWAQTIWDAVTHAEPDATPPRLAIVDHVEAGAWLCPASDTVYVSIRMVEYAYLGRHSDGADLLGFVFAHELAHRRFDPGEQHFGGRCPDVDPALEALADHRATLLLARATHSDTGRGFSPFQLARRDTLRSFFAAELGWAPDCPALNTRVDAARAAIDRLGELATAYRTALIISAAGLDLAPELLASLSPRHDTWEAVPELALVEAALHLARASPGEPCPATLPRFSRVAPLDLTGARADLDRRAALRLARDALDRAKAQRLPEASRLGLELCHARLADLPTRPFVERLEALGRRDEAARIRAWPGSPTAPAPRMSGANLNPEALPLGGCGPLVGRFTVGTLTLSRLGECLEVNGRVTVRIEPVTLREEHRPLGVWLAACRAPSHWTDDGVTWWGSTCSLAPRPERWVLEVRGERVERAWLVTPGP